MTLIDSQAADTIKDGGDQEGEKEKDSRDNDDEDRKQAEQENEKKWATVLGHIRAGEFNSAVTALPLDQQPDVIKGESKVAGYLTGHTVTLKPLAAGKTAKKLSVCRLNRRFRNDEWEEMEQCNQGFLVASSNDGCTITRHINTVHFGASRRALIS